MKSIKIAVASTGLALLAAFGGQAFAAPVVASATGSAVYGTDDVLVIKKDTSSGNRVAVRYASGWQYVADDASWSKFARFVNLLGARALPVGDGVTYVVISASNGIVCQNGNTLVAFASGGQAEVVAGCAFFQAVQAAAN